MIYMTQANTWSIVAPVRHCNNSPVDLSAATVRMMIKKDIKDDDEQAVITKEVINPESSDVMFQLSAEETAAIQPGEYMVGVKIFFDSGPRFEVGKDSLLVEKGVFDE